MRILSVSLGLPKDDAAHQRMHDISRLLKENGHEVDSVHYYRTPEHLSFDSDLRNHEFVRTSIFNIYLRHLTILKKKKYDLVYGNRLTSSFCAQMSRILDIPIIYDRHGDAVQELFIENNNQLKKLREIYSLAKYWLIDEVDIRLCNCILCVSKNMIENLADRGVPLQKMHYVTNGVDLSLFRPVELTSKTAHLKSDLGIDGKFVFGYLGSTERWQGVTNLVEAARRLNDKRSAVLIVGGQNDKKMNENIVMVKRVPRTSIIDYYSICDVLILPRPKHPATTVAAPTKFSEYTAM